MLLQLPSQILRCFLIESVLNMNGNCSSSFLGQFPCISLWNLYWKLTQMLLELPGPIPSRFFIKSLLKVNGNALGACWANDLPASQPTNQFTNQPTNQICMEIGPRTSWAKCFTFLYETFIKSQWKHSWSSLDLIHCVCLLNLHYMSMEMLLELVGPMALTLMI